MRNLVRTLPILLLLSSPAVAQVRQVSLDQRVDEAAIIVEGRVVASTPFMNPAGTMIYTAHRVQTYKVLKTGTAPVENLRALELITPGGRVGDEMHVVTPSLSLMPGDTGLLFIGIRHDYAGRPVAYVPSDGTQSFIEYRASGAAAFDPFVEYDGIARSLYAPIRQRSGSSYHVLESFDAEAPRGSGARAVTSHSITSLVPGTVKAGVQEVLTINGSGFGASQTGSATVFFDDSDDGVGGGFGSINPEHVVSWSDSQIRVRVPNPSGGTTAGTGKVIVTDAAGDQAISPNDVIVEYALREVLSSGTLYRLSFENENVRGGYSYRYSTNTASNGVDFTTVPDAMARFEDALESWNCAAGWSADADGTTTVNTTGNDGVNIVSFDNDADPLGGSTLGRASVFFSGCGGDSWYVNGMDIRFKRDGSGGVDWYYGANPAGQGGSEDDFESVALHEIGHTVQHGHINDPSDVMHYSITTGTSKRTLSSPDIAGGQNIVSYSVPYASCGKTGMLTFDCQAAPTAAFSASTLGGCASSLAVDFTDQSQNGPTGWAWTLGDTAVSSERNPSHTYTSQGVYSVSLAVTNSNGGDAVSKDDLIIVTDAPTAASCAPTFAGHNDCCGMGVKNVTLNTIDHATGTPPGDPLHEDFTCSQFTVLESGQSYPITVITGGFNDEDVRVWIDWNDDGTLSAGELAFSSDDTRTTHSGSVVVPGSAVQETALRMRVASDFWPQGISGPCENIEYGQVEDYSVIVSAPAAAAPGAVPSDSLLLTRNGGDPTKLDLSWSVTCGAATDYTIHEGTIGNWYSHTSVECSTSGATSFSGLTPEAGDRYYLVVPVSATDEGGYGLDSTSTERPVSTTTCRVSQDTTACP